MKPEELLEEWTEGQSGMRPQRVQQVRDELEEYTDMYIPRRIPELEGYIERMKGEITKRLKEAVEDDSAESDESSEE